ncbi:sacsin N-terminal ATP-binding-like domain-containing protein [Enterococcus sp. AZ192]|uniref:sacsin N-terminal ATP-binding-like domain-containing protein n=1 Tax=unclassified Enterococcus TaxID=2608891 RepID=UPI003D2E6E3E
MNKEGVIQRMAYLNNFQNVRQEAYERQVATKILDMIEKLTLSNSESNKSRWVWELLQNAKDVSYFDKPVDIQINFDFENKKIEFSHNGRPFRSKDITFLIEQVSTKERNQNGDELVRTTGKFGTGFLTTHLLSKVVQVEGIVKDSNEPHKKFNVTIDRSGKTIEEICASVNQSMRELELIDYEPDYNFFSESDFNTKFTYQLNDEGLTIAKKGLEDLERSLPYTMVFVPEINSVSIISSNVKYYRKYGQKTENICLETIICMNNNQEIEKNILVSKRGDITFACPVEIENKLISIKEIDTSIPKLFCDFPLGDTKDFVFPGVVNNPFFYPDEPREKIYLTNKDNENVLANKNSIITALHLFIQFLNYASDNNFKRLVLLAEHNAMTKSDWIDQEWLKNEVVIPLRKELSKVKLVHTYTGEKMSILNDKDELNVQFPSNRDKSIRNEIWKLSIWISGIKLPKEEEIDLWAKIIWFDKPKLTLATLASKIILCTNIQNFTSILIQSPDTMDPMVWLNWYYRIALRNEDFVAQFSKEKLTIFPNQNSIFTSLSCLKKDVNISEEIKDIADIVNVDCRNELLHKSVILEDTMNLEVQYQENIVLQINQILSSEFFIAIEIEDVEKVCFDLISLFPMNDENFYNKDMILLHSFCKTIFPHLNLDIRYLENWTGQLWEISEKRVLSMILTKIGECKNIVELKQAIAFNSDEDVISFIDSLVSFFLKREDKEAYLNNSKFPIFPNQNGHFLTKDELYLDSGNIDGKLKDISRELGTDFRETLLEINIFLDLPESRCKTKQDVASEIYRLVMEKFEESGPLDEQTKESFRSLVVWFKDNKEEAKHLFTDLYKNKHRLYDEDVIVENLDKAEKFDAFLNKYGVTIKDLEILLSESKSVGTYSDSFVMSNNEIEITTENLIQSGISSQDELDIVLGNSLFGKQFIHSSNSDQLKFDYVQKLLNRSKENVLNFLKKKGEYDFSNYMEISNTIILARKNEEDIFVIIRPSDYDQVIIYYDTEKDILDFEKDWELWVENGKTEPQKISFGKILKMTGINRIPLYQIE